MWDGVYMKINTTAIVATTINMPTFLDSFVSNFETNGILPHSVVFIVVGDEKSKPIHKKYAERLKDTYPIEFWDVSSQKKWIKENYPNNTQEVDFAIPYNSARRRNFGLLRALELGTDITIMVDDDNLPGVDWLKEHHRVFENRRWPLVSSMNKIVNPCRMLEFNHGFVYSRGYPISEMFRDSFTVARDNDRKVVLNMGLWVNKPDVDAYTNIAYPDLDSKGIPIKDINKNRYAIFPNNYFPMNSQNTSFRTEIIPALYQVYMGNNLHGLRLERYEDIWSGWFTQKIMHGMGDTATFGLPLTFHDRNVHSFEKDLKTELIGIALNKRIFDAVNRAKLNNKNYSDDYLELADVIEDIVVTDPTIGGFLGNLADAMRIWIKLTEVWI